MGRTRFRMPSFEEIQKRSTGGSDFGGLGKTNPLFDSPYTTGWNRTFSGPTRPAAVSVAPVPPAVSEITGRHAGAYVAESAGTRVAAGRRIAAPSGRHSGEYLPESTGSRAQHTPSHRADLAPGRHKGQTALSRMWSRNS